MKARRSDELFKEPSMNTRIRFFLAAILSSASLLASASEAEGDRLAQIHSGQTADEVRALAGAPENTTGADRAGERVWIYDYTDPWGYQSTFEVTFDAQGVVTDTYTERQDS
jgi:outer membrane protein assembly factor BamE (lipoprotein component of BamABCDE complex)